MRHIKLQFNERDFEKLKREKERQNETSPERLSWERFVFQCVFK